MLELVDKDIKVVIITMLHTLNKLSWNTEDIEKTQVELLEIKNIMSVMKN